MTVRFKWLEHGRGLPLPMRQSMGASGHDIAAAVTEGETLVIAPGAFALVPCGFPTRSRSGAATESPRW